MAPLLWFWFFLLSLPTQGCPPLGNCQLSPVKAVGTKRRQVPTRTCQRVQRFQVSFPKAGSIQRKKIDIFDPWKQNSNLFLQNFLSTSLKSFSGFRSGGRKYGAKHLKICNECEVCNFQSSENGEIGLNHYPKKNRKDKRCQRMQIMQKKQPFKISDYVKKMYATCIFPPASCIFLPRTLDIVFKFFQKSLGRGRQVQR